MSETEELKEQAATNQEASAQAAPTHNGEQPQADGMKPVKKSKAREALEWLLTILGAVAIAFAVRGLLFEPIRVDGHSMDNTLSDGEVMLVTKPEYIFGEPQRFDVVICHYPGRGSGR